MILGGIPYYLKQLDKDMTFDTNVDNLFFRKRAELWDEYEHLYDTLFTNSENYTKVVELLAEKRMGLTRTEISEKIKIADNSDLTKILNGLVDSGFIRAYSYFGKRKQKCYQHVRNEILQG